VSSGYSLANLENAEQVTVMRPRSAFQKRVYFYFPALLICTILLFFIFFPPTGPVPKRWSVNFDSQKKFWTYRKVQVPLGRQNPGKITFLTIGPLEIIYVPRGETITSATGW
jgi:hypothetical protein